MLSGDVATMWKGTQFMTERTGGSDVGSIETVARCEDGEWRLFGDKWFCSHADADVALLLARPEGAPAGTRGLALFALPRRLQGRLAATPTASSASRTKWAPVRWHQAKSSWRARSPIWSAM